MGWQWHQLNHMQIICTSLQSDNHTSTTSLKFFTGRMCFLLPNQQHQNAEGKQGTYWLHNINLQFIKQPFYGPLSVTTRGNWYQKHSPTHTYPDDQSSFICFFHLLRSTASSLFNLCAWQSFCTTFLQVLFGLPFGLAPSTSYSTHFFTQTLSSFCNTCP